MRTIAALEDRRPFVVGTGRDDPWSPFFADAMAEALATGRYSLWRIDPDGPVDPIETGRFLEIDCAVPRLPGLAAASHRVMIDWRSGEHLLALSGLTAEDETWRGSDGRILTDPMEATGVVAAICARIAETTFRTPLRGGGQQEDMTTLLIAAAATCGASDPDGMLSIAAPSPWSGAEVREIGSDGGRTLACDPEIEAILPRGVSVSVRDDGGDGVPIIRIDAYASSTTTRNQPAIVEAMRTIGRGWTHG